MTSKLVLDRQKASQSIIEAAATNAPAIDAGIAAATKDLRRKRGEPPAVAAVLGFMADVLEQRTRALVEADEELARELADDAEPRERRDEKAAALYLELTEVRSALAGGAGPAGVRDVGFLGDTPRDPTELSTLARRVHKLASGAKLARGRKGVKLDLDELVSSLVSLADAVEQATRDIAREERERHAALAARDAALASWNRAYQGLAGALEGFLVFAGLDDLAERVRPVLRRGGGGGGGEADPVPAPGPADGPKG